MSKVNLPAIPGGYLSLGAMNTRFAAIEAAFENTLSLDGSSPNSMEADLDMDSNDILNVGLISVDDINVQGLTTGGILTEASEAAVAAGISAQEAEQSALDASANAEAKQVDSVSELRTSTFPANITRLWLMGYYGVGTPGGGPLYRDDEDTETDDNDGTVFVDDDGVRWKRNVSDTVLVDWFGVVGDGVTEEESVLRAAVAATPERGNLIFPDRDITILIDIPTAASDGVDRPRGLFFDKPITVKGSRGCTIKVKDFCSAWQDYSAPMTAIMAEASDVTIDGLRVDANADNHYETDVDGNKWWETGPEGKRPPIGIGIQAFDLQPILENCEIKNCYIYRPLGGISVIGALGSGNTYGLDESSFIDGSIDSSIIKGARIHNNVVERARGNDYLFSGGVRSSSVYENKSINSSYHHVRFYAAVIDCEMSNNRASVDYDAIESLYNATDLGYWRTDLTTDDQYAIRRSGYRIGSGWANNVDNGGNVRECSCVGNSVRYTQRHGTWAGTIVNVEGADLAGVQTSQVATDIRVAGNEVVRHPGTGIFGILTSSAGTTVATGVIFENNTVVDSRWHGALFQGDGLKFIRNTLFNVARASGSYVVRLRGEIQAYRNTLTWNSTASNGSDVFFLDGENADYFISDNFVSGYTGDLVNDVGTGNVVHGTDGGGVPLTLINDWAEVSPGTSLGNVPKAIVDCAGNVTIEGYINGSSATDDKFADTPASFYNARENQYQSCIQANDIGDGASEGTVYVMRATSAGSLSVSRRSLSASRVQVSTHYLGNGVI